MQRVLSPTAARDYKLHKDNEHWTELRTDGLTVIRDPNLSSIMRNLAEGALYPALAHHGTTDQLKSKIQDTRHQFDPNNFTGRRNKRNAPALETHLSNKT